MKRLFEKEAKDNLEMAYSLGVLNDYLDHNNNKKIIIIHLYNAHMNYFPKA